MEGRPGVLELRLKNYKSVAAAHLVMEPLTILVGPNGAGKSNILDALRFLGDAMRLQFKGALDLRGGVNAVRRRAAVSEPPSKFGVGIQLALPFARGYYAFEVRARPYRGYTVSRERCIVVSTQSYEHRWFERGPEGCRISDPVYGKMLPAPTVEPSALLLPVLSGALGFSLVHEALTSLKTYAIPTNVVRDFQDPDPGDILASDARNITSVIRKIQQTHPEDYERVCEFLHAVVPGTRRVTVRQYGNKLGLQFHQEAGPGGKPLTLDALSMSDGTLRVLGILAAVFQPQRPALIAIEEPESTIHPGALSTLMDILKAGRERTQILITTHSPEVLDAPDLNPASIQVVRWNQGVTTVAGLSEASLGAMKKNIATAGELLRSNYLRPANTGESDVDLFPPIPGVPS